MIIFSDNFFTSVDLGVADSSVPKDLEVADSSVPKDLEVADSSVSEDFEAADSSVPKDLEVADSSVPEDLEAADSSFSEDLDTKDSTDVIQHSANGETQQSVAPTIVNDIVVPDNSYSKYCFFFLMLLFALFVGRSFRKGV